MPRSLKIRQDQLDQVKLSLIRNGYPTQRSLAEHVGLALTTVNNFLNGRAVDYTTFEEIARRLSLDWKEIADLGSESVIQPSKKKSKILNFNNVNSDITLLYPSGILPINFPYYITRNPLEEQIKEKIAEVGALVQIRAPRETGKSSMLLRVLEHARSQLGYSVVTLNLAQQLDRQTLVNFNQFLRWLCANTAIALSLEPRLDEFWSSDLGSKTSSTRYFQNYLLLKINTPLVLALDNVDRLLEYPHSARDFFFLLNFWYQQSKTSALWQKLRLVLVSSTGLYTPFDLNYSPFNLGLTIKLRNFEKQEVEQLSKDYGLNWDSDLAKIIDNLAGQPFLVHQALYHLSHTKVSPLQLLENSTTFGGIYFEHLNNLAIALRENQDLSRTIELIINSKNTPRLDPLLIYKLSNLGLVKINRNRVSISSPLYYQYFKNQSYKQLDIEFN